MSDIEPTPGMSAPVPRAIIAPAPAKRSCAELAFVIIATVICTIIAEVILGFIVVGYVAKTVWQKVHDELSVTTTARVGDQPNTKKRAVDIPLTSDQKALLQGLGIKPEDLPAFLTPEKIVCFQAAVGSDRVKAIISGQATPGFADVYNAKSCL